MYYYFEATVRYERTMNEGNIKMITEKYILTAASFAEAEERITIEIEPFAAGQFDVKALKTIDIREVMNTGVHHYDDKWFKCKVIFITINEITAEEKRTPAIIYVLAKDTANANSILVDGLRSSMIDYEIDTIQATKISELFQFEK
jgi:hypothetical protein